MELLDFITKLAKPQVTNDSERYWRIVVNCFLVEKLEQLELGSLPAKFKQYYGKTASIDGKLSELVQEPQFKAICVVGRRNSAVFILPSEFILRVLCARLDDTDPKKELAIQHQNNNNANVLHRANPFAIDALREIEQKEDPSEARFGRLTLEELNCAICLELLKEAVEGNCCRNIFCLSCIEQNGRKCPNCRRVVEWTANEPIRRLIRKKPVQCKECGIWSTASEIEQHQVKCEFNPVNMLVSCEKCQQRIVRKLLEEHLSDLCEMVKVPCRNCGFMFIRKEVSDHETQLCELRRVICTNGCAGQLTYKEYISRHINTCPNQLVKCTSDKCPLEVRRDLLQQHLQSCAYVELPCHNSARGCPAKILKANKAAMRKHLDKCDFKLVSCAYGCKKGMLRRDLNVHECNHMPLECRDCHQVFKKMHANEHLQKCPERLINCPNHCGEAFKPAMEKGHMLRCPMRLVHCQRCSESLVFNTLEAHMSNVCPKRPVTCNGCKGQLPANLIEQHMATQCAGRTVTCDHCHERFTASYLNHHMLNHCSKRQVPCPKCKEHVPVNSYNQHLSTLCPKRLLPCPSCKIPYAASDHEEHVNRCPKRALECPQGNENVSARNYDQHVSEQCLRRIIECQKCEHQMVASYLPIHVNQDCPQRKIQCHKCRKLITFQEHYNHLIKECTARQVTCDKCGTQVVAYNYSHHSQMLCPRRQVPCNKCKCLVAASDLDRHMDQCQKAQCKWCRGYIEPASLTVHESNCPEQLVPCPDCHETFTVRNYNGHRSQCPRLLVECNDCNEKLFASYMASHKASSCIQRRVACDKCRELVLASFKTWHDLDSCPARTVECKECLLQIPFKKMATHYCIRLCPICNKAFNSEYETHVADCAKNKDNNCIVQ